MNEWTSSHYSLNKSSNNSRVQWLTVETRTHNSAHNFIIYSSKKTIFFQLHSFIERTPLHLTPGIR